VSEYFIAAVGHMAAVAARRMASMVGVAMTIAALAAASAPTMAMEVAGIKLPEKIALGKAVPNWF
jgi:hypothetical protein